MNDIINFIQGLIGDPNLINTLVIVVICVVAVVLLIGFSIVGNILGIFLEIFELVFEVIAGGPAAWCGCIALIFVCIVIAGLAIGAATIFPTCGTPDAVNLCRLLGY